LSDDDIINYLIESNYPIEIIYEMWCIWSRINKKN